jgi:transcription antitermination factor NusA-like protein
VRLAARLTGWKIDINGEKLGTEETSVEAEPAEETTPEESEEIKE